MATFRPIGSPLALGAIGGVTVQGGRSYPFMRATVAPTQPKTAPNATYQQQFANAVTLWNTMSSTTKAQWTTYASGSGLSAYYFFMSRALPYGAWSAMINAYNTTPVQCGVLPTPIAPALPALVPMPYDYRPTQVTAISLAPDTGSATLTFSTDLQVTDNYWVAVQASMFVKSKSASLNMRYPTWTLPILYAGTGTTTLPITLANLLNPATTNGDPIGGGCNLVVPCGGGPAFYECVYNNCGAPLDIYCSGSVLVIDEPYGFWLTPTFTFTKEYYQAADWTCSSCFCPPDPRAYFPCCATALSCTDPPCYLVPGQCSPPC